MNYLQDQAVMNFAGTAARGSAIGTAVQEGMVTYQNDSNTITVYDGSVWKQVYPNASTGNIIQVVSSTLTTTATSSATTFTSIGLTASITPSSTSSKILALASIACSFNGADTGRRAHLSIFRSTTNLSSPTSPSNRSAGFGAVKNANPHSEMLNVAPSFLDSPASTSSLTYSVQIRVETGDTFYVNRSAGDTDSSFFPRGVSSLTLFEVAG
jgi:hypothetical protein